MYKKQRGQLLKKSIPITSKMTPSPPTDSVQIHWREVIGAFVVFPALLLPAAILHCPFPIYNTATSLEIIRF